MMFIIASSVARLPGGTFFSWFLDGAVGGGWWGGEGV